MPEIVNMHAAKSRLSRLVQRVLNGEEIVIARNGQPVARLVAERKPGRTPGRFVGANAVPDSAFFGPMPESELTLWEGGTFPEPPPPAL